MKKVFIEEYLAISIKDLVKLRNDFKKDLFNLRVKNALKWLKQTHHIRIVKWNIARINSALSYKLLRNGDNMK